MKGNPNRSLSRWLLVGVPLLVSAVGLFGVLAQTDGEGGATYTTSDDCAACHADVVGAFGGNPHGVLEGGAWAGKGVAPGTCTACHGDATEHIESGGGAGSMFTYGDAHSAAEQNSNCLECHATQHPRFLQSPHAKGNMTCTSCHSIHDMGESGMSGPKPVATEVSATCQKCHQDVFTQFNFTEHHRLQEGAMTCTSCHNPHEPSTRGRLAGFKQEQCSTCHVDKQGPFIFEHGANRIEGCTACHQPHGSINRHQLTFQSTSQLCYTCHSVVAPFGVHRNATPETDCTYCHVSIHGSNVSPTFLDGR